MRKYFPIYEDAVRHIWLCNCSILNFLIYEENLIFFFISLFDQRKYRHWLVFIDDVAADRRHRGWMTKAGDPGPRGWANKARDSGPRGWVSKAGDPLARTLRLAYLLYCDLPPILYRTFTIYLCNMSLVYCIIQRRSLDIHKLLLLRWMWKDMKKPHLIWLKGTHSKPLTKFYLKPLPLEIFFI